MTPMILLVLVVLWVVVLAPGLWRRHNERQSSGSIESFHHQLHLLERTGPKIVAPAYRLETVGAESGRAPEDQGLPTVSSMPGRPNLVLLRPVGDGVTGDLVDDSHGGRYERVGVPPYSEAPRPVAVAQGPDPYRRRMAQRRRRDLLTGLAATLVLTALLGIAHSLRPLWVITVLSGFALVGYVLLAGYAQRMAAERRSVGRPAPPDSATAGFPGAWDESLPRIGTYGEHSDEYDEPARALGVR